MSIMDMFRSAKAPDPLSGAQQAQAQEKKAVEEDAAKKVAEEAAAKKASESPLDKFSDVFKIDEKDGAELPLFNIDPTKLTEQAAKTSFVNSIPPEKLAEMAKGGEEGVKAALEIINNVAQSGYAQATLVSAKLVEHALEKQSEKFQNVVIPHLIRQMEVHGTLTDANPALNHPAIAPILASVQEKLAKQHPDAPAKELASMAQDFVSAFATAVNPPKDLVQQDKRKGKETDWSLFLES